MQKYKKGNITLEVRVPKKTAISILGRLYGSGILTRSQYQHKISQIDKQFAKKEQKKQEKMYQILSKILTKNIK